MTGWLECFGFFVLVVAIDGSGSAQTSLAAFPEDVIYWLGLVYMPTTHTQPNTQAQLLTFTCVFGAASARSVLFFFSFISCRKKASIRL